MRRARQGAALIVVMVLLVGLSVLVAAWAGYTQANLWQGILLRAKMDAMAAAGDGVETARALLAAHREEMLAAQPPGSATPVLGLDQYANGLFLTPPLVQPPPQPAGATSLFVVFRQDPTHFRIEALGVVRDAAGRETYGEMVGIVEITKESLRLVWKHEV